MVRWRSVRGIGFVVAVYLFGLHLTAPGGAAGSPRAYLYALFGPRDPASAVCCDGSAATLADPGRLPSTVLEVVSVDNSPFMAKSIDLGQIQARGMVVSLDGLRVFVLDAAGSIAVYDVATGGRVATFSVPEIPVSAELGGGGTLLYVTTEAASVIAINASSGARTDVLSTSLQRLTHLSVLVSGGGDEIAIGATSGGPALFRARADAGRFSLDRASSLLYPCGTASPAGDDVAFTTSGWVMVNNRGCQQIASVHEVSGSWFAAYLRYADQTCSPNSKQNMAWYSPLIDRTFVIFGGTSGDLPVALPFANQGLTATGYVQGFSGTPEVGALTPDGRRLLVIKQMTCQDRFKLDAYDVLTHDLASPTYSFVTPAATRAPVDVRVIVRDGALPGPMMSSGVQALVGSSRTWLKLGLLAFGVALWRLDRRRKRL